MSSKKPILIDFVYGIKGVYQGQQMLPDKPNLVWVSYTPFNAIKVVKYPEPVPKEAIKHVHHTRTDYEGVDESTVFIIENAKGERFVADQLNIMTTDTLKKMETELEQKTIEASTARHRATSAKQESVKQIAQDTELKKKDEERARNPFEFGYRPRYLGDFNRNNNTEDE